MAPDAAAGTGAWRARLSGVRAVWALNVVIVAAFAALFVPLVRHYPAVHPDLVPWWVLAAAIAFTERFPVHLEFRRSAHSFSLTDVPVALVLLFNPGDLGVLAIVTGGLVALTLRRLPPVKVAFNVAQFACATTLAYVVVHLIAGPDPTFGPRAWIGVLVGIHIGGLLTMLLMGTVMSLVGESLTRADVRQMMTMDGVVTATNVSLALVLAVILVTEPTAAPILLIPITIAFLAYRSYITERQRHEKLEFLYEANRGLSESREVAHALVGLLGRALEAYRSEQAEVILFTGDESAPLRTSLGPGDTHEHMAPADPHAAAALHRMLTEAGQPIVLDEPPDGVVRHYMQTRGIRHAMVAELRGEARVVGLLLLANRTGFARRFSEDDLALFDTLAVNASAALQFDRLEQAVSDLRDLQERLHHEAYHDPLTGLANRALFRERVTAALTSPHADDVAVLFIDLDDFKAVNDTLGHAVGDRLLRAATRRLAGCVRDGDLVARLGGDEFAVLCVHPGAAREAAVNVARRVLDAFDVPLTVANHVLAVRLSIGIASSDTSGDAVDSLLRDADVAMYEAKESGKAQFAVFDPEMRAALLDRIGLKSELEKAIAGRNMSLDFQPIFDMESGRTTAMEALVRWDHPERGRLAPAGFIPQAEETGLIVPLGHLVLEEACRQGQAWAAAGSPVDIQVNLSAREIESDGLLAVVTEVLARTGLDPARLVLEITESLLARDPERSTATLHDLRALGVRLALDDFGTGYSSLSYLRSLPLDTLKIAKEFIDGIAERPEDAAFVRLIIEMAATFGLTVVAEGIETPEQLETLQRLGCAQGQGFLYGRPEPASAWDSVGHERFARRPVVRRL